MRRIIVAKLTVEDSDMIQKNERNYHTYITLLENQFLNVDEKSKISKYLPSYEMNLQKIYKNIMDKYKIPYSLNSNFKIDPQKDEIYLEVK